MSETWRGLALTLAWGLLYAVLLILPTFITVPLHVHVVDTPGMVYAFTAAWLLIPLAIELLLPHTLTSERSWQRKKSLRVALIALALAYAVVVVIGAAMNIWQAIPNVLCNSSNYYCLLQ